MSNKVSRLQKGVFGRTSVTMKISITFIRTLIRYQTRNIFYPLEKYISRLNYYYGGHNLFNSIYCTVLLQTY